MNRKKDIEQLFRQHYAKMYNLARCILSDDDESKDVVSEVFAQILADDVETGAFTLEYDSSKIFQLLEGVKV